ncbi:MAG: GTPase ObgE [Candidatus Aminicenantes bacterium]|nr:GTPase ObgE [Candidatus Aminicenantes bacterium]
MFVDSAVVTFIAGKGGNGCVSFRREKYVPKGGPDGGKGGDGGNIILTSKIGHNSLIDFKFRNIVKAAKGKNGSGSNKNGKRGKDEIMIVPAGTVVKTFPDNLPLFDFSKPEMHFTVAKGGKGGNGNTHFKSAVNQAPKYAQEGEQGETVKVVLELKLIAFAGLVGLPNAGKSTLISKISGAKPKIADYPFTTLTPHLGVVYRGHDSLVAADIPGIIAGAHRGEGMGLDFLKHIERNKVLIFLLDVSPYANPGPLKAFDILQDELNSYDENLLKKKYIVAANKIDLVDKNDRKIKTEIGAIEKQCAEKKIPFVEISALAEINLERFKDILFELHDEE